MDFKRFMGVAIVLIPFMSQGQTFKHSILAGPNYSYYTSTGEVPWPLFKSSKPAKYIDYGGYGGSVGYKLEYHLPKTIVLGTFVEYLNTRAVFNTKCYCDHDIMTNINIVNDISTHTFDLPLYMKLKTNNKNYTYVNGGIGINYLFVAKRKVDKEIYSIENSSSSFSEEEIAHESFPLRSKRGSKFGSFYHLGIGQHFRVKKINLFAEFSFRQDINSWQYETYETNKELPIQRNSLNFKVGVMLNQKRKE